jgi:hypothetical protein
MFHTVTIAIAITANIISLHFRLKHPVLCKYNANVEMCTQNALYTLRGVPIKFAQSLRLSVLMK